MFFYVVATTAFRVQWRFENILVASVQVGGLA